MFDSLSKNVKDVKRMFTLIERFINYAFQIFINDHSIVIKNFDFIFIFLYKKYFLRIAFEFIYFIEPKTHIFSDNLELLDFQGNVIDLRPFFKHREKIRNWFISTNRKELNVFL